jgi:hypothetical protein
MKRSWTAVLPVVMLVSGVTLGVATAPTDAQQQKSVIAKRVAAEPALDGTVDATWSGAPVTTVKVMGGKNLPGGSTDVAMRAVYTTDTVYLMLQYRDATESFRRSPWQKQADGSWKKLGDPADKGGDNNVYYEDKVAVLWNISTPSFEQKGCMTACHTGEGKPFGNKYTPNAGERLDLWHAKFVRGAASIAQIDDQYVDNTRYDEAKAPEAGRKGDPKTGGGYVDNVADDKKGPKFALKGNKPAPPYWIVDGEKEPFDDGKYKAGDEVPSILVAPFAGDRGDISGTAVWKDGTWTLVMKRKLVTGSEFDVQFDDMKKPYAFGVAVFDNAQVRHAFSPGVLKLMFE